MLINDDKNDIHVDLNWIECDQSAYLVESLARGHVANETRLAWQD